MKLTNEKLSTDYLKHLQEQQRHTIAAKQAELRRLNKEFEHQEKEIRKTGQQQVQQQRIHTQQEIHQAKEEHAKNLVKLNSKINLKNFKWPNNIKVFYNKQNREMTIYTNS
jgi:molybdopterin/thiamine biosynthesis adenylyltransferase